MRDWIARHPLIFCVTVFAAMMLAAKFGITWAVDNVGGWVAIVGIGICLLFGLWTDYRDHQRG